MRKNLPSSLASGRSGGFALVVVLAVVLMVSVLVVGLLIMAENETKAAARYMDAADARLAADSVVEIVQGQIKEATLSGIDGDGKGTHAWASQPGAVRVFDDTGDLVNIFKLYSSDVMVSGTANFAGDVPANWQDQPDAFVDLNAPVRRSLSGTNQWIYPIASPEALPIKSDGGVNLSAVVGFNSTRTQGSVTWDDRLAMPVRWVYVQKDGTMNSDPSVGDPVLRVAYWTDDESSKININTASATDANSYADIPRANYTAERDTQAWRQPAQNEFNRYPGHPATVNLNTVFSGSSASIQKIVEASPRYQWGGSQNTALKVTDARTPLDLSKRNRLYVSPDEYLFSGSRQPQLGLTSSMMDQQRFFLTANSRSSDLNLFGQPRVTIWPLSATADANHRSPYDDLIGFCSTIGSGTNAMSYFFQRLNPLSQTDDWDSPLVARNQSLFGYLQGVTAREIPGFGGNFLDKYDAGGVSGERDQILTEIFDYIRCTNLNDTYAGQPASFMPYTTKVVAEPGGIAAALSIHTTYAGGGYVLPIRINASRGAGRVPVISEVGLWLIQTHGTQGVDPQDHVPPSPAEVQPALIIETFSPMQGYMLWLPKNFSVKVRNITPPQIRDESGGYRNLFPDDQTESSSAGPGAFFGSSQSIGGIDGFAWNLATHGNVAASIANNIRENPFLTKKADAIPVGGGPVEITAGEIEISFQCDPAPGAFNTKSGVAFQTYRIQVPACTLPVPGSVDWRTGAPSVDLSLKDGWYSRVAVNSDPTFNASDVVRGIEVRDGDFRTIACLQDVPASFYLPHMDYNSGANFAHGFRGSLDKGYQGTTNGGYLGVSYGGETPSNYWRDQRPKITSRIADLRSQGWEGDFDNGIANLVDGPYLNKSDEGGNAHNATSPPYFYFIWHIGDGLFSPLKQAPSPVIFGSLPTGVKQTLAAYESGNPADATPWRTLNFCPNPLSKTAHFGLSDPPDYLMLDLFTMPVVEPYAISEPFSTAGRLNMNSQIVPFTYIKRQTSLYAAMASQQVTAIADTDASTYKTSTGATMSSGNRQIRYPVNIPETLKQFDRRFDTDKDLFRSASEICSIFLVPDGTTATEGSVAAWWDDYQLTGNNSRERPYATLYPLLTTKSNVFTTHLRVQAIKRGPDGKIHVNSEYRGSVMFERFLDPNDPKFQDGTVDPDAVSLEPLFRFRTLAAKQFDL